jgi:hypothetical protein
LLASRMLERKLCVALPTSFLLLQILFLLLRSPLRALHLSGVPKLPDTR